MATLLFGILVYLTIGYALSLAFAAGSHRKLWRAAVDAPADLAPADFSFLARWLAAWPYFGAVEILKAAQRR